MFVVHWHPGDRNYHLLMSVQVVYDIIKRFHRNITEIYICVSYLGSELAYIRQKSRLGMPHYEIYRNGQLVLTVKQKFKLIGAEFKVIEQQYIVDNNETTTNRCYNYFC